MRVEYQLKQRSSAWMRDVREVSIHETGVVQVRYIINGKSAVKYLEPRIQYDKIVVTE